MGGKLVDNQRLTLAQVLLEEIPNFKKLSIATGYWDLPGFQILQDALKDYESIRLLIGQEPLPPQYAQNRVDLANLDDSFPERQFQLGLEKLEQQSGLRNSAGILKQWLDSGKLEVKVFRGNFLHAKAYIFGDLDGNKAIGLIGSSNFTNRGLTQNLELNYFEDDSQKVLFQPANPDQPHGHLTWFNELWDNPKSENWNGKFQEIIDASPLGDLTNSQYEMYIKVLYELYESELVSRVSGDNPLSEILYEFQMRNATLLMRKLDAHGVAMLADSVGLGKTITAGGVIKTYIEERNANRIYIIAPANLTEQWKKEFGKVFKLFDGFQVISMQDLNAIKQARELDQYAPVDLFVVDEAHNLRSGAGSRFGELLDWFTENPESHVLMLTATPINNSLKDIKNQIQLGAKGKLQSFPVVYRGSDKVEVIDFYEAIDRLNANIKTAVTAGKQPDYEKVNEVMRQGLRHFMVRTTRKGIEKEFGGLTSADGTPLAFPKDELRPQGYKFTLDLTTKLVKLLQDQAVIFNDCDVARLNVNWLLERTQRTEHPLDSIKDNKEAFSDSEASTPFEAIFQVILLLGFAPYKSDIYKHKFLHVDVAKIKDFNLSPAESFSIASQLSIHNMLRVTLLKRLESSQYALKLSLVNYRRKLVKFQQILIENQQIVRINDMDAVLDFYEEDPDASAEDLLDQGIEYRTADPKIYNIEQLKQDLKRDLDILAIAIEMCNVLGEQDDKLESFAHLLNELSKKKGVGKKILVFSYFSDTIEYLEKNLPNLVNITNFATRSAYTAGKTKSQIENLAKRFSPISKGADSDLLKEGELDFLFSTDVLSEGQNLQDCGTLINFDLHWNPVRMIQRNGRINRIGSPHEKVFIYNMHPEQNLNEYLELVERLQLKIEQIRHAVGTDQSVLGEEAKPMEFVDLYDPNKANDALNRLEKDDDTLLTEDEFINDLRKFDETASPEIKRRVKNISLGKWGYAPAVATSHIGEFKALSLVKIQGLLKHSGQGFTNYLFVRASDTFGVVETYKALSALRVAESANQRVKDTITLDRDDIAKKSIARAKIDAKKNKSFFPFTFTVNRALDAVHRSKPEMQFAEALKKIQTIQTKKRAHKIIKAINKELKLQEELSENMLAEVEVFIQYMDKFEVPKVLLEEDAVQGVLYFAK
jgi:ERCC4-related helicase